MSQTSHQPHFYPLPPQDNEQPLRCPFAHRHQQDHDHDQEKQEPAVESACPYHPQEIGQDGMHDEMPPEHEELKKGYTGSTCPFLETNDVGDNEEEETVSGEMTVPTEHESDCILRNDAQPSIIETVYHTLPPLTATPQNAKEARQRMDQVINAQREAQCAIHRATEQIIVAQNNLNNAEIQKMAADELIRTNTEELADLLLQEDTPWNKMYRKLVEYKIKHGHCDVKRLFTKEEKVAFPELAELSQFVGKVRRKSQDHLERIEPYKIAVLNRLEFDWAPRDNAWMQNYEKVKAYMIENPGKLPQRRKSELGVWANGQIIEYNKFMVNNPKAYITQKKIDMLNRINFPWDRTQNTWLERFQSLQQFHSKNNHCRVSKTFENQVLYRWVTKERMKYRNYLAKQKPCQSDEQWNLLKTIGFMEGSKIPVVAKKRRMDYED
eukprot:scaffold3577_cov262-Chaetoceros_neogracile.AAC.4